MKRIITLLLSAIMLMSIAVTASAAEAGTTEVTVKLSPGSIHKEMSVEDTEDAVISYSVNTANVQEMTFYYQRYTVTHMRWNPNTLAYDLPKEETTTEDVMDSNPYGGVFVNITNRSNRDLTMTGEFRFEGVFADLPGSLITSTEPSVVIGMPENKEPKNGSLVFMPASKEASAQIGAAIKEHFPKLSDADGQVLGKVVVSISYEE